MPQISENYLNAQLHWIFHPNNLWIPKLAFARYQVRKVCNESLNGLSILGQDRKRGRHHRKAGLCPRHSRTRKPGEQAWARGPEPWYRGEGGWCERRSDQLSPEQGSGREQGWPACGCVRKALQSLHEHLKVVKSQCNTEDRVWAHQPRTHRTCSVTWGPGQWGCGWRRWMGSCLALTSSNRWTWRGWDMAGRPSGGAAPDLDFPKVIIVGIKRSLIKASFLQ